MKLAAFIAGLALLTACSHGPSGIVQLDQPAAVHVEKLQPFQTINLAIPEEIEGDGLGPIVTSFDLSENGEYFLALSGTREYQGETYRSIKWLEIYDAATGEQVHRSDTNASTDYRVGTAGFIGQGHYYLESEGAKPEASPEPAPNKVQVLGVALNKEVAHLPIGGVTHARADYLFASGSVLNWKTGKRFPAQYYPRLGIQWMTEEGAVLSANMEGSIALHKPVHDDLLQWESGLESPHLLLSADGDYVVAQGDDFRCSVWRIPSLEKVAECPRSIGSDGYQRGSAMHPQRPVFALAWENTVRLYDLDQFGTVKEIVMPHPILGLSMTNDQLVIQSREGLDVWDIDKGALIAKAEVPIHHWDNVRTSQNGIVAVLLDRDPDDPESPVRPVWIYRLP